MQTKEFEYLLPKELIAQEPIEPRDSSKLLVLERRKQAVRDEKFGDILNYLKEGDILVLNDSRVIPVRLPARKITGGKAEVFLLKNSGGGRWEALVKPNVPSGTELFLCEDRAVHPVRENPEGERDKVVPPCGMAFSNGVKILEKTADGSRIVEFSSSETAQLALEKYGQVPLPLYIKKPLINPDRYQTVYAKKEGSVAAPTAALHFTTELLKRIEAKGVEIVYLTLHMGWGTFRPIKEDTVEKHRLPDEYYNVSDLVAQKINAAKKEGRRVIACGTDVVRTLETVGQNGAIKSGEGMTSFFITPGYKFKIVNLLITNLHLPRSSHLVLVSTFAGKDFVLRAYQYAIEKKFRFYTFGDATLVI